MYKHFELHNTLLIPHLDNICFVHNIIFLPIPIVILTHTPWQELSSKYFFPSLCIYYYIKISIHICRKYICQARRYHIYICNVHIHIHTALQKLILHFTNPWPLFCLLVTPPNTQHFPKGHIFVNL